MKADAEELKALVKGKSVEELFETAEFKRLIALNGKFKCGPSRRCASSPLPPTHLSQPASLPHRTSLPPCLNPPLFTL